MQRIRSNAARRNKVKLNQNMVRHSAKKDKRKRDEDKIVQQERKRRPPAPQLTQEDGVDEDEEEGIVRDFEIETVELPALHDEGDEVEESEAGGEVDNGEEVDNDDVHEDSNDDDAIVDIEAESSQKENEDGEQ